MKVCIIIMAILLPILVIIYIKNRGKGSSVSLLFCISMITVFLLTGTRLNKGISLKSTPYISVNNPDVKISAFLDNITPSMNSTIYATVKGPPGGKITIICHYKNKSQPFFGTIDRNGVGVVPISVGSVEPNFNVIVDVVVEHSKGTSKTILFFIPK